MFAFRGSMRMGNSKRVGIICGPAPVLCSEDGGCGGWCNWWFGGLCSRSEPTGAVWIGAVIVDDIIVDAIDVGFVPASLFTVVMTGMIAFFLFLAWITILEWTKKNNKKYKLSVSFTKSYGIWSVTSKLCTEGKRKNTNLMHGNRQYSDGFFSHDESNCLFQWILYHIGHNWMVVHQYDYDDEIPDVLH